MTTISTDDIKNFKVWSKQQGYFTRNTTLLRRALDEDLTVYAQILLQKGVGFGMLAHEIRAGNNMRAEKLIRLGVDVHEEIKKSGAADPALEEACRRNNARMAELLIEAGYNVDHQGYAGRTALIVAALRGHLPCIELLIRHNANPNIRDGDGDDAAKCARLEKMAVAVDLLEEYAFNWKKPQLLKLLPAPEQKPEAVSQIADGWTCTADLVVRTATDSASNTRVKNIFDFAARQLITEISGTGSAPHITAAPFSAVDPGFLALAEEHRGPQQKKPGLM